MSKEKSVQQALAELARECRTPRRSDAHERQAMAALLRRVRAARGAI